MGMTEASLSLPSCYQDVYDRNRWCSSFHVAAATCPWVINDDWGDAKFRHALRLSWLDSDVRER